jgi:hypothetical protein
MPCPFCDSEMSLGWVQLRGFGLYTWFSSLRWVPDDRQEKGRLGKLLSFRHLHRGARACYACGAIILDPMD